MRAGIHSGESAARIEQEMHADTSLDNSCLRGLAGLTVASEGALSPGLDAAPRHGFNDC